MGLFYFKTCKTEECKTVLCVPLFDAPDDADLDAWGAAYETNHGWRDGVCPVHTAKEETT